MPQISDLSWYEREKLWKTWWSSQGLFWSRLPGSYRGDVGTFFTRMHNGVTGGNRHKLMQEEIYLDTRKRFSTLKKKANFGMDGIGFTGSSQAKALGILISGPTQQKTGIHGLQIPLPNETFLWFSGTGWALLTQPVKQNNVFPYYITVSSFPICFTETSPFSSYHQLLNYSIKDLILLLTFQWSVRTAA